MKKILSFILAVAALTGCYKVDIYDTVHPDHGKLTLSTDWSARTTGIDVPANYTAECVDPGGKVTLTGTTAEYPNLFIPGTYTLNLYNTADKITVSGTTATVATVGAGIDPMPGFQFWGTLTKTIEADKDYSETIVMQQVTRQLEFDLTLSGSRINDIQTITASLSGVAGAWDMATNTASGAATTVAPAFTRIGSKLAAMVRLLGTNGAVQKLTVTLKYNDNTTQTEIYDYSSQLSTFNANKVSIAQLTGSIATPTLVEYSGNINDWNKGNGETGEDDNAVEMQVQPVSNSYLITSATTETVYRIPVSRVNEFWKASGAICTSANVAANVIGATDPWTVALLWQDVDSLVSATDKNKIVLSKASGKGADDYFTLTVPAGYAGRGNFVIAIAKGAKAPTTAGTTAGPASGEGAILWSWHFWVSDKPSEILSEPNYPTFMDRNMGALSAEYKYPEGALYYQFGRKDPLPANVTLYDIEGKAVTYSTAANAVEGQKTMAYAVNNPLQFIMNNGNWCSELAADTYLWNDPKATDKTKKSLFDPTPVGYRMPINGEFDFMSKESSSWENKGRKHTASGLFFPAVGFRDVASGAMFGVAGGAYCWSSSPNGATSGFNLSAYSASVLPQNYDDRAYGFPVRCVQE